MDRSDVVKLIKVTTSQDKYGATHKSKQQRTVFCDVASVSSAEFFRAHQNNLNAQFQVKMFRYDYEGETLLEYDGKEYSIYRTHCPRASDDIELYVERKAGTDKARSDNG